MLHGSANKTKQKPHQFCGWVDQGHHGNQPICQPFKRLSLFSVQESMDGSVKNFDHSLQMTFVWLMLWGIQTFWKSRGIVNTLEVRCSQHLAEADGFSFLKITLQREIWPMGHSRKTDLDKMKDRFMTQISCSKKKKQISCSFGGVGQGNLSTCWIDYDQSCLTWHKCHSRWNWTFSWDTGLQPNRMNW